MKFRGKALCVKLRVPCSDPRVTSEHMQDLHLSSAIHSMLDKKTENETSEETKGE